MSDDVIRDAVDRCVLKLRSTAPSPLADRRAVATLLNELAVHATPAAAFELHATAQELWRSARG